MDYHSYMLEKLLQDEKFQDWIWHPTKELDCFWLQWQRENPGMEDVVSEAREILSLPDFEEHFPSDEQVETALQKTFTEIDAGEKYSRLKMTERLSLAAAILLLLISGYVVFVCMRNQAEPATQETKISDNPEMKLQAHSSILYAKKQFWNTGGKEAMQFWGSASLEAKYNGEKFFQNTCCLEP